MTKKTGSKKVKETKLRERKSLKLSTTTIVLTEAGYRCAVPTCRNILALNFHHMLELSKDGGDDPSNLVALCSYCHGMYHLGHFSAEAIYAWKAMLVAISRAFDLDAVDRLLFLSPLPKDFLIVTGDGLLHFARLIAAGLATAELKANNNWLIVTYAINISPKGKLLIDAWKQGNPTELSKVIGGPVPVSDGGSQPA